MQFGLPTAAAPPLERCSEVVVRWLRRCRGGSGGGGGCVVEARSGALPPALCTCSSAGILVRIMPHRALLQASVPSANGEREPRRRAVRHLRPHQWASA